MTALCAIGEVLYQHSHHGVMPSNMFFLLVWLCASKIWPAPSLLWHPGNGHSDLVATGCPDYQDLFCMHAVLVLVLPELV